MASRIACPEQLEEVLSINTATYDGDDYLGPMYRVYLQQPNTTAMLWYIPDQVSPQAFLFTSVVDDGRTILLRGGRSRNGVGNSGKTPPPTYSSLAAPSILKLEASLIQNARSKHRGVERVRAITSAAFPNYHKIYKEYTAVAKKPYLRFTIDPAATLAALQPGNEKVEAPVVRQLTKAELRAALLSRENSSRHFDQPSNTALVAFIPYATGSATNVDTLLRVEQPVAFAAPAPATTPASQRTNDAAAYDRIRTEGGDAYETGGGLPCETLSFGTRYLIHENRDRVRYDVDLYCDSLAEIRAHLRHHVGHLAREAAADGRRWASVFLVFRDERHRRPLFEWCCERLVLDPARFLDYRIQQVQTLILFERPLPAAPTAPGSPPIASKL